MIDIEIWLGNMRKHLEKKAALNAHNLDLFEATDTHDVEEAYTLGQYEMLKQCIDFFKSDVMKFDPVTAWEELG